MSRRAAERQLSLPARPRHAQLQRWLYDAIRAAILTGRLPPGTRLPASRDLARQQGLSRGTVVLAYAQLAAEGYLAAAVGRGSYVAERLPDPELPPPPRRRPGHSAKPAPMRLSKRGLMLAQSPFPPAANRQPATAFRGGQPALDRFPIELWTRIAARRSRLRQASLLGDGDAAGYLPLRCAIAEYLAVARGLDCDAASVLITASVQQGLDLCARLLLDPGDAAWMEDPGYPAARLVLAAAGAKVIAVPVDGEGLQVAEGIRRAPAAKLAYVTPAHQAPLGVALGLERRLQLLRWATAADAYLFEDDYDSEYRFHGRPLAALKSLDGSDRVIYAGTFSKLLFPGLRLAYLALPAALAQPFAAALSLTARHPPLPTQAILADFIAEGHFARHLRRMRLLYAERAAALQAAAVRHWGELLRLPPIEAGLETVAWLADGVADRTVVAAAAAAGIELRGLSRYRIKAQRGNGLVLGFAATDPAGIDSGARRLAGILVECASATSADQR